MCVQRCYIGSTRHKIPTAIRYTSHRGRVINAPETSMLSTINANIMGSLINGSVVRNMHFSA